MISFLKILFVVVSAGLFYMIARFTDEYLHPYKRKG
jgi:hypothetical protein